MDPTNSRFINVTQHRWLRVNHLILTPVVLILLILISTRIYTTLQYRRSLSQHLSPTSTKLLRPPQLPYTLPFLGNSLAFLAPKPGLFFTNLFKRHPRSTGACTLILGGRKTHILFSTSAVNALFKAKGTSRDVFLHQVVGNSFELSKDDIARGYGLDKHGKRKDYGEKVELDPMHMQEKINTERLLRADAVNEMTTEFTRVFRETLDKILLDDREEQEVGLYAWLQSQMFKASTTALMGSKILEVYPELETDFFQFERAVIPLFFGLPKFYIPDAYRLRKDTIDGVLKYRDVLAKEGKSKVVDPDGAMRWEPWYGSRANRARQSYYETVGYSARGRAGLDLGFMFGLLSNAIPCAGWILMHLLDPAGDRTVLQRVLRELESVQREDGSLDIPTLVALPLLQSIFQEILRLYTDVLVTREVLEDLTLPIENGNHIIVEKGGLCMAPSFIGSYDPSAWDNSSHPVNQFYAERFLTITTEGKQVFSLDGTAGKLFPFGGGKSICPGRVFAKQEVFAAVGIVLLTFDFKVLGFSNATGQARTQFPGIQDAFSGTGVLSMDGDIKVRMKRSASPGETS